MALLGSCRSPPRQSGSFAFLVRGHLSKTTQAPLAHSRLRHRWRASHRASFLCCDLVVGFRPSRRKILGSLLQDASGYPALLGGPLAALGHPLLRLFPQLLGGGHPAYLLAAQ